MLRLSFALLIGFCTSCIIFLGFIFIYINPSLPDISNLDEIPLELPLKIYTADGTLISEFGELYRTPVSIRDTPQLLIQAFVASEDDRFYQHPGVDWQGLLRAAWSLLSTQSIRQGGSTITMQVARNYYLTREKTYTRKLQEIVLAFKMEKLLSKDQIMELYLNKVYFGKRAYGIKAAAQVYYGKSIYELDLPQMAMIAGQIQLPSTSNPIANPESARKRRNYVLTRMFANNIITEEQYKQAIAAPVTAYLHAQKGEIEGHYIAEMVRRKMLEEYGEAIYKDGLIVTTSIRDKHQLAANTAVRENLYAYDKRHGYRGVEAQISLPAGKATEDWEEALQPWKKIADTHPALVVEVKKSSATIYIAKQGLHTLNWTQIQWARPYINANERGTAPQQVSDVFSPGAVIRVRRNLQGTMELTQIPAVQGSLFAINPNNGEILALVGGYDFYHSKFNRVTQALRQPGSSFKPFIYAAALHAGKSAAHIVNDAPIVKQDAAKNIWRPRNYSRKFYGATRLREALINSRNLVSIRLLEEIGVDYTLDYIKRFGFDVARLPASLSLALGSGEVTAWELTRAYSVLANGGHLIAPWFIKSIRTYNGEVLFTQQPLSVCTECTSAVTNESTGELDEDITPSLPSHAQRVIHAHTAYIMNTITRDVIKYGTGRRALALKRSDLGGKTGTTNQQRDAWFAGYNAELAAVVWVGFDSNDVLGKRETGASTALPAWIRYMQTALENQPETSMARPEGLVNVRINADTGKAAQPGDKNVIFEYFPENTAPPTVSEDRPGKKNSSSPLEQLF